MRSITKLALVGGAAAAVLLGVAGPAGAEPPSAPAVADYVAVGSDTLEGLENQFQADFNAQTPAPASKFWSYNAVGTPSSFAPKGVVADDTACATITRPNGSGAGINALLANATTGNGDANSHFCVNIARSSRALSATEALTLSAFRVGQDAVSWAAPPTGNAPTNLSGSQLYHILKCDPNFLHWNESGLGGTSADAVYPLLPQVASGTRAFFLTALNATQGLAGALVPGPCVDVATQPEENHGTAAIFTGANAANIVFPYSAAVYAAQHYNGRGTGGEGTLTIRNIDNNAVGPILTALTPSKTINPNFAANFVRPVYNVVRTAAVNSTTTKDGAVFSTLVAPWNVLTRTGGWECQYVNTAAGKPAQQLAIEGFGFFHLKANCGRP